MKRTWLVLVCLQWACLAWAVEVRQVLWGFDGQVLPDHFNLLSVLVANPSESPYDRALVLYRTDGLDRRLGAELVQPCFLSAGSSRWVQFYPYVSREAEDWVLVWGSGARERMKLSQARLGAPACVFLRDPNNPFALSAKLKSFPDNLFPPTVTVTDSLDSVLLDHVPGWEPTRRQAFLDWLCRGGTLHLLPGRSGQYPQFTGELARLNAPVDRLRVGAGLVVKQLTDFRSMSKQELAGKGFHPPRLYRGSYVIVNSMGDFVFPKLKKMSRPAHNWWVIYVIIVIYIGLIGPANYVVARSRRGRCWIAMLFFLVLVISFSYSISVVGRRGYGEATRADTLAYARALGDGNYDVTQWTNTFVTHGAVYTITHTAGHNLYSTCQQFEAVKGQILNGRPGIFRVDIPLYSSRSFLHRARMKGPDLKPRVVTWQGGARLTRLVLEAPSSFPEKPVQAWALHRDRFYPMTFTGGRLELCRSGVRTMSAMLGASELAPKTSYARSRYDERSREAVSPRVLFEPMIRPLIAYAIGGTDNFSHYLHFSPFPKDHVQLFIFAPQPESFCISSKRSPRERGFVLYHLHLFKPGS